MCIKIIKMYCPITKKDEEQAIIKKDDDGIYLKCKGCNKTYGKEIGEMSFLFDKNGDEIND